ncbi:MAG TPA: hypothetical protein VNE16_10925 [Vicinamibacterales bacterium]|nr:hypothetical protein [Vicinamibacterales bacterium]
MSEERRRILEMLAQGKISVADAERLLQAVGEAPAAGEAATSAAGSGGAGASGASPKYLHVHVHKNPQSGATDGAAAAGANEDAAWEAAGYGWRGRGGGRAWRGWAHQMHGRHNDVDVRIPVSLLRSGMKLAAIMPGRTGAIVSSKLKERGLDVDLSRLDPDQLDEVLRNLGELTVDMDNGRGQVRIYCE